MVANCNNPDKVIANCEPPQEATLCQYDIEKLIVTVRDEQVLIDQDIARIYGVTTGRLNGSSQNSVDSALIGYQNVRNIFIIHI